MSEIVVYLDSADYSNLSNVSAGPRIEEIAKRLISLSERAGVTFAYSGTHLSEMAPTVRHATGHAISRTDLLSRLCRRNALISFDRLVHGELECLRTSSRDRFDVLSRDGTWFPSVDGFMESLKASRENLSDKLKKEISSLPLNRKQRRAAKGQLSKFARTADPGIATSIAEQYPMRPQDAQTLNRYMHGQASLSDAEAAFLESFRDPKWLMRWTSNNYESMQKFSAWHRAPAQKLMSSLRETISSLQSINERSPDEYAKFWKSLDWKAEERRALIGFTQKLSLNAPYVGEDVPAIEHYCPGIATMVRVLFSIVRDSTAVINPRPLRDSDFLDAVHALYAPYVDVYRTDGYMTPIVASHVGCHGTKVIQKLDGVPDAIELILGNRGNESNIPLGTADNEG